MADAIVAAGAGGELQPHALAGLQVASNKSRLPHARKFQLATIAMGLSGSDSSKSVVKLTSEAMAALKDVEQLPDTGAVTKVASTGGGSRASTMAASTVAGDISHGTVRLRSRLGWRTRGASRGPADSGHPRPRVLSSC